MSSNIVFNGVTYSVPADGDNGWGPDLTNYFISIASNALQKTGGTFTLTAEAAFGATYGLKAPYFKSYGTNPAAAGAVRLANTESISWRNNANGADLALSSNASDALIFNSKNVLFSALGLIVNADINAAAAIAYSKLAALTASRLLVSDGSGVVSVSSVTATEAGYLAGVTSAIQTQMNLKAPLASPTFSGTITTALTASRLLVSGASNELAVSAVTAAEAAYLSGVTSAIQTQLDAKIAKSLGTTKGDIIVYTSSGVAVRLGVGINGQVVSAASGATEGINYAYPTTSRATAERTASLSMTSGTTKITSFATGIEQGSVTFDAVTNQRFNVSQSGKAIVRIYAEVSIFDGSLDFGVKVNGGSYQKVTLAAGQSGASSAYIPFYGFLGLSLAANDYVEIFYNTSLSRTAQLIKAELEM